MGLTKLDFATQYKPHKRFFTEKGSGIKDVLKPIYDDNGELTLIKTGEDNLYESIQSHADSVDINVLLKRFANGDVTALNAKTPMFGDFTEMPKTYADMLNVVLQGENYFNSLPVETRAKYNHSFAEFMATYDKLAAIPKDVQEFVQPATVEDVKDGVIADE